MRTLVVQLENRAVDVSLLFEKAEKAADCQQAL